MGFTHEQITNFRKLATSCAKPLILFDDDCDGLTSFLMLYRAIKCGKGIPVKNSPEVTDFFLRKVEEYTPDAIFILDKPLVSKSFLDAISVPVIWLDHHLPQKPTQEHVHYFNPRILDDTDARPTSYWTYQFIGKPQDVWLGVVGSVGDWHVPEYIDECRDVYPTILPATYASVDDLYVDTPLATLILVTLFIQKGSVQDVLQCMRTFTRIEHPDEILKQTTPKGTFLWKKYLRFARPYERLKKKAQKSLAELEDEVFVFEYAGDVSFTKELSTELHTRNKDKIIIVARIHEGSVKASLRSRSCEIDVLLKQSLVGLSGHGGGHKLACGMSVSEQEWPVFLERFKEAVKKALEQTQA